MYYLNDCRNYSAHTKAIVPHFKIELSEIEAFSINIGHNIYTRLERMSQINEEMRSTMIAKRNKMEWKKCQPNDNLICV